MTNELDIKGNLILTGQSQTIFIGVQIDDSSNSILLDGNQLSFLPENTSGMKGDPVQIFFKGPDTVPEFSVTPGSVVLGGGSIYLCEYPVDE